jgi:4-hydroxybenzoate polyprenyltransferase
MRIRSVLAFYASQSYLQDTSDDKLIGVKSTALYFGENSRAWLAGCMVLSISSLAIAGYQVDLGFPFYLIALGK